MQRNAESRALELALQYFTRGLREQEVARVITLEDIEEQAARRLQLARSLPCSRKAREDETCHACELTKLTLCHLRGVERGLNVLREPVGAEQRRVQRGREWRLRGR